MCENDWPGTLGSRVDQEVKPPAKKAGWRGSMGVDQTTKLNEQVWEVRAQKIVLEAV